MSLGRNDPCHCGSGRKYKKCCLQKDYSPPAPNQLDFAYESFLALRRKVTEKMGKILLESATDEETADFVENYWHPEFLDEEEVEALRKHPAAQEALERQLPIALINAMELNGRRPADFMLEERAERFSAAELRYLRSFAEARLTYVQLREFHPDAGYAVAEDIFDGTRFNVYDKAVSTGGRIHDIVSARLVPFPEKTGHVMEPLALSTISPDKKDMLIELLGWEAVEFARSHLEDTEEEPSATPDEILELLKQDPMVFYWMEMRIWHDTVFAPPPKLVTMDGEDIIFIKARFACPDPAALRSALIAQRNFQCQDEEGAGEVFTWLNRQEYVMGRLRIDSASRIAHLETNSRERLRKWRKKLRELGDVTFLEKTEKSPDELTTGASPGRGPAQGGIPPEEWKRLAPEIEKHLAEKWLKEKIPMLGGLTPVQAARTPEGREKLRELFDYIENRSAGRSGPGSGGFDVDAMKKRLGLSED